VSLAEIIKRSIRISRPIFWLAPFASYSTGLLLAGVQRGGFEIWELFLATFPLSFSIYFLNDYYDMEYDAKSMRKGGFWGHRLEKKDIGWGWNLVFIFLFLAIATALFAFTFNILHAILIIVGILLPYLYSAPPIRLKNVPVIDSLTSAGYIFFPFAAAASLGGSWIFLDWRILLAMLIPSAAHAIATIMDHDDDKKVGQKTFSTVIGMRAPAMFSAGIFLINAYSISGISPVLMFVSLIAGILSIFLAIWPSPKNAKLFFKLLLLLAMAIAYFFLVKYLLFPQYFADYSEKEIEMLLTECDKNPDGAFSSLCMTVDQIESDCHQGIEYLGGSCDFLQKRTNGS
jgi:4-hydroxybenzoate polyprenyltransferase